MRLSVITYLQLSCLASSVLAVHHPLHQHRHGDRAQKRAEVLIVEEDVTVEVIEETIYLPGPPPSGRQHHHDHEGKGQEKFEDKEFPLRTSTLPDGSVTVFTGPKPTGWRSGYGADKAELYRPDSNPETTAAASGGIEVPLSTPAAAISGAAEAAPSNPTTTTTSSAAGDSVPGSDSASLGCANLSPDSSATLKSPSTGGISSSLAGYADSTSSALNPPTTTASPTSSVAPTYQSSSSTAASSAAAPVSSGELPFSALVAFGDNLSDNGNGSYAHNVAADNQSHVVKGNAIYGARTWTNGPVAVSYLTDLLGVPMNQNFAFGHAWGGSDFGATIDDTLQQSNFSAGLAEGPWFDHGEFSEPCWGAPSAKVQINDYIGGGDVDKHALHFLWIGANDMNAAYGGTLSTDPPSSSLNEAFASHIATKIPALVTTLLDAGAPYVLVANLYPKHLAPLWPNFLKLNTETQRAALGAAIASANSALASALKSLPASAANRVIYHDTFTFLSTLYTTNPSNIFPNIEDTNGWPSFCDGDKEVTPFMKSILGTTVDKVTVTDNWDYCVTLGHQDEWFWMQYLDMTSHVHRLLAQDMEKTVRAFFSS